jgi:Tfp pilus assembly protein PilF
MRAIVCLMLALALAGCGSGNYSADDSTSEDNATTMLMLGTAFMNGMNQGVQRPVITCYHGGSTSLCY